MRCIVWTGSRGWKDVETVVYAVESLAKPFRSILGGAAGFDTIIEEVLAEYRLPRWVFNAKWKTYGKGAGHVRNRLMLGRLRQIDPGGFVIAGWDGESKGTRGCMEEAERRGIDVWQVSYWRGLHG